MGVDYVLFERLCELSTRFKPEGRSLMLGRHTFETLQSDYEVKWAGHENAGEIRLDGV